MSENSFIPVNEPLLGIREKKYLLECIETGWISSEGPFIKKFENLFASQSQRAHGIAVSSGTASLDIAIASLDIKEGDEVILPSFTIISCISQIIRAGATPVLIDSDPISWNMNVELIESKITNKTKAIMIVHIFGLPVDIDPVIKLANRHGLRVIEDAAQMIGQTYKGKPCGSFGDMSVFSFYPNKHITTGEGGMILVNDDKIAEDCRSYRNLCFHPDKRFVHERLGWNYRMTNIQAALGLAQLERLEQFILKKRQMGAIYNNLFRDLPCVQLPLVKTNFADNIYWVYGMVLDSSLGFDAKEAINRLSKKGIGCRPFFYPMHKQPVLLNMGMFKNEFLPESERLSQFGFYIPSGLSLTEDQMKRVSESVMEVIR